jgi:hypothetical protein
MFKRGAQAESLSSHDIQFLLPAVTETDTEYEYKHSPDSDGIMDCTSKLQRISRLYLSKCDVCYIWQRTGKSESGGRLR